MRVDQLEVLLLVAFSLAAALTLMVRLNREQGIEQRQQNQWLLAGLLGGYVPFLLLYLIPWTLGWNWAQWTTLLGVVPLGLVPVAFAWAILKYKLWDLGVILRDSISYSLTALVGLLGFSLINLVIQREMAAELLVVRNLLAFGAGLAIAGVMVPTRSAIAAGLERLQYRGSFGSRRSLVGLGQQLLRERQLDQLFKTLTAGLRQGLEINRLALYLRQGEQLLPVGSSAGLPAALALNALGEELWQHENEGISAVELPEGDPSPSQLLFAAGFRYVFPLTVRQHQVGLAFLGYKAKQRPLSSEDVDLIRGLLNQAALAVENAQLLAEVHRQLAEVQELKEHNKGIIESSPAGLAVLDEAGNIVSANQAFGQIVGQTASSLIGRTLESVLPVRPLPPPGSGLFEVSFCDLRGAEHYLQLSHAGFERRQGQEQELPAERAPEWRILVVQDVSEKTAMEMALKEKEQLASLGMLAAGVAHEVNTPITGISSYAQLLLADTQESDPHYSILQKMERQSFRAAQIVNNLLEFARNRRGEFEPVQLHSLLTECAQLLAVRAGHAKVEIDLDLAPETAAIKVAGRESELHQVFTNLLVNAIDAMKGGGAVRVTTELAGQRMLVRIADTGPGIAPERLERVFQPFFSSKLDKGGTGLGLAITYNIVRRHGGEISVANNSPAKGCTFTVALLCYQQLRTAS